MPRKNILMVGPSLNAIGGISSFCRSFLEGPVGKNHSVEYFDSFSIKNRLRPQDSKINFFELYGSIKVIFSFFMCLRKFNPDLVYVNSSSSWGFWEKALLVLIATGSGRKTVLTMHGPKFLSQYQTSRCQRLINFILNKCFSVSFVSREMKDYFAGKLSPPVFYIPNPVDFDANDSISGVDVDLISSLGILKKNNSTIFLSLSLLEERKRVVEICEIFSQCHNLDYSLIVAGDGVLKDVIKKYADENENILYVGAVQGADKNYLFEFSDVFLQNSVSESFCITVIESLMAKKILVSTDVGVVEEIGGQLKSFISMDEFSSRHFHEVQNILDDAELEKNLTYNSLIAKQYSWDHLTKDFEKLFGLLEAV